MTTSSLYIIKYILHCIMKHSQSSHYVIMFGIMVLSGLLSTMNVWVDKIDDIIFSVNDAHI